MHGFNPGKYTLDRVQMNYSYFLENSSQTHYYEYVIIGLLLIVAMSVGFFFGSRYVIKKQFEAFDQSAQNIHQVDSVKSFELDNSKALCLISSEIAEQGPANRNLLEFMKNQTNVIDSFLEKTLLDPKINLKNVGNEKSTKSEFEITLMKKSTELIKTETHKITTAYSLDSNNEETTSLFQTEVIREDGKTTVKVNTYPTGEFSHVIEILDNGNYSKKFTFVKILGHGGFSEVQLAKHKLDDQLYAIKIVRMKIGEKEHLTNHKLFAEVNAIKTLQSKYVVRYITCWAEVENSNSVMPLMSESSYDSSEDYLSSSRSSVVLENYMTVLLHIQMEYCQGTTLKE